jgi:hypothetical protein
LLPSVLKIFREEHLLPRTGSLARLERHADNVEIPSSNLGRSISHKNSYLIRIE